MPNDRKLGTVQPGTKKSPIFNQIPNISIKCQHSSSFNYGAFFFSNCAEKNSAYHLLNTYSVYCALKPHCEKSTMKNA